MTRVSIAILFYILAVATLIMAEAPAESPKATTPAKAPEATKKSAPTKAPEAATAAAPVSRKSSPAAAPATTSTPSSSTDETSSPPSPSTSATSPTVEGPAEGPTDADQSGAATLSCGAAAMAGVTTIVATMIFY